MARKSLAASVAKRATKVSAATEESELVLAVPATAEPIMREYVPLAIVADKLKKPVEERKKQLYKEFLEAWTAEYWNTEELPSNPRFKLAKFVDGKPTDMDDLSLLFCVTFKKDGIKLKLKKGEKLRNVLERELIKTVGLSEESVAALLNPVDGYIVIEEVLGLPGDLYALEKSKDQIERTAVKKLLGYLKLSDDDEKDKLKKVEFLTADECRSLLVAVEVVTIKETLAEKLLDFCDTIEQLRAFVSFLGATPQLRSTTFGVSDKEDERLQRLSDCVCEFLAIFEAEEEE